METPKLIMLFMLVITLFYVTSYMNTQKSSENGKEGNKLVVYVVDKGLYYDTFIKTPLSPQGRFQLLDISTEPPSTKSGPDDPDYLGGRWWVDDGDRLMEDNGEDIYFSGPLQCPGRKNP